MGKACANSNGTTSTKLVKSVLVRFELAILAFLLVV